MINTLKLTVLSGMLCIPAYLPGQTVVADVKIDASRLRLQQQEELRGLVDAIEFYVGDFDYTDGSYDFDVQFTINIFIESFDVRGSEKIYYAQTAITNGTDQRYFDKRWNFVYSANDPLYHSGVFHPLTSFIDFYAYLILGGEMDLVKPLAGSEYYNSAREVAARGKVSNHSAGWENRIRKVDDFLNNRNYRVMKGIYSDFMFILYDEGKPAEAYKSLLRLIDMFDEIFALNSRDRITLEFMDAHKEELCKAIFGYRNKEIFERLIEINPDNKETYRSYLEKLSG